MFRRIIQKRPLKVNIVGFYGISTFVGYLTPNPFFMKFKRIQFNMSTVSQKHFYFKIFSLFKQFYITIQFIVSKVSMSKTVRFQIIQFSVSTQFKCKSSLYVKKFSN